jgi:hypothetical protein
MESWFVVSRLMNHDNEWPEKETRLIWSYFLFYLFLSLFLLIYSVESIREKIEKNWTFGQHSSDGRMWVTRDTED